MPFAPAQAAQRGSKSMIGHSNIAPAGRTVLIVDDDPAVRSSLQFCLEVEGFLVRTYSCGSDLLNDHEHASDPAVW